MKKNSFDNAEQWNTYSEKERRKHERKEKWQKRKNSFWKAFLFTKDGKPKSGLLVYTFCLSLGFLALYIISFAYVLTPLESVLTMLPTVLANLFGSLICSAVVLLVSALLHRLLSDKRLMFGTYVWLALYAVVVLITEGIMLWGDGATFRVFLDFFVWFMLIPVVTGLPFSYHLFRRDYVPEQEKEEEPEWKKYVSHSR
ncbi:MAG: hypothetical protein LUE63_08980 [Lachnospiraceae bacterium]|nr:hypothetical protein [Lachnospiraceae bacterium]